MNLYTLLGAALADAEFREMLFDNPVRAARSLGIVLTNLELNALRTILSTDDIEKDFQALQGKLCHYPPCPLNLARCDDDDQVNLTSAAD